MPDNYSWHLRRCWQQVVHKASVQDLSIVIKDQPLEEGSAYTLGHTAMHLPLDHHGIDHPPTIVYCHIFHKRDHARGRINLDNSSMHTTGKARVRGAVKP